MYLHTKNKLSRSRCSKVTALQTDTKTDANERITRLHSQVVISTLNYIWVLLSNNFQLIWYTHNPSTTNTSLMLT